MKKNVKYIKIRLTSQPKNSKMGEGALMFISNVRSTINYGYKQENHVV